MADPLCFDNISTFASQFFNCAKTGRIVIFLIKISFSDFGFGVVVVRLDFILLTAAPFFPEVKDENKLDNVGKP